MPEENAIRQSVTMPAVPSSPFVDSEGKLREDVVMAVKAQDRENEIRKTLLNVSPKNDEIITEDGRTVETMRETLRTGLSEEGRLGEGVSQGTPSPDAFISDRRFQQIGTTVGPGVTETSIIDARSVGAIKTVSHPNELETEPAFSLKNEGIVVKNATVGPSEKEDNFRLENKSEATLKPSTEKT